MKSVDQVTAQTSRGYSLKLQWLAQAPRYKGAMYTYIWRPYVRPPETINAQFHISTDDHGSQNVLVYLQGWDHSKGSLHTYKLDRLAGPPDYNRSLSNVRQEIQLHLFAAFKQLIADSDAFVDSAYEEVARLVSLYLDTRLQYIDTSLPSRHMTEDAVLGTKSYIFCFISVTAVVALRPG